MREGAHWPLTHEHQGGLPVLGTLSQNFRCVPSRATLSLLGGGGEGSPRLLRALDTRASHPLPPTRPPLEPRSG